MRTLLNDDLYSTFVLGMVKTRGVVTFSGHDRKAQWDVQQAKGTTGATSKREGDPIGRFTATLTVAGDQYDENGETDADWLDRFVAMLWAMHLQTPPAALPIYHPDLARNNFTEVSIETIGGVTHDGLGGESITIGFIEYRPPKPKPATKAKAKPSTSTASTAAGMSSKPDPNAAAKAELAGLLAEARTP
jgi:hypothetical protein